MLSRRTRWVRLSRICLPDDEALARARIEQQNLFGSHSSISQIVTVALIGVGGPVAVAVTALILGFRVFNSLERQIKVIESDLKNERLSRPGKLSSPI